MSYKYTSDGRKVAVIGKLNNTETIVQEVFVIDGNELPSGENFVVKSLHDAPAVSWKDAEIKKMDARYEQAKKEFDRAMDSLRGEQKRARCVFEACAGIIEKTNESMFESIGDMIAGEYKFIVENSWSAPRIYAINDFVIDKDGHDYSPRLLAMYGKSNGNFVWGINRWGDGSGSWSDFYPCKTMEEAKEKARTLIEEKKEYSDSQVKFLEENILPINPVKLSAHIESKKNAILREIEKNVAETEKLKKALNEFEVKL
jgi:hypothetical protein